MIKETSQPNSNEQETPRGKNEITMSDFTQKRRAHFADSCSISLSAIHSAVIFDMDGLLLDSERITMRLYKQTAEVLGWTISEDLYRKSIGLSVIDTRRLFSDFLGSDFPFDTIHKQATTLLQKCWDSPSIVKRGVREFLGDLRKRGIPIAVATSTIKGDAHERLLRTGLLDVFRITVTGDQVKRSKPKPDIFLRAASLLCIEPDRCIVIEDSYAGVQAARSAGMTVIHIPDILPPTSETRRLAYGTFSSLSEAHAHILYMLTSTPIPACSA